MDLLFENSGGRALKRGTPIQRFWRDAHAGRVHAINDPERALSMFGRGEFGLRHAARRHAVTGAMLAGRPWPSAAEFAATSRYDAAGMRLHYHEAGPADGAPARAARGAAARRRPWRVRRGATSAATCRSSPARFRTLMVDQPGFGRSDKPPVAGKYFTFAADALAGLLDGLGIEQVHLIGNSLGGGTAVRFALRLPRARGPPGADGPGRAEPERVRARTRPRASSG